MVLAAQEICMANREESPFMFVGASSCFMANSTMMLKDNTTMMLKDTGPPDAYSSLLKDT